MVGLETWRNAKMLRASVAALAFVAALSPVHAGPRRSGDVLEVCTLEGLRYFQILPDGRMQPIKGDPSPETPRPTLMVCPHAMSVDRRRA